MSELPGNGGGLSGGALYRAQRHAQVLDSVPADHVIILVVCAPIVDSPTAGFGFEVSTAAKVAANPVVCKAAPALLMASLVRSWADMLWELGERSKHRLISG